MPMLPSQSIEPTFSSKVLKNMRQRRGARPAAKSIEALEGQARDRDRELSAPSSIRPKYLWTSRIHCHNLEASQLTPRSARRPSKTDRPVSAGAGAAKEPCIKIYEASQAVGVVVGGREVDVPPHTWLLLECPASRRGPKGPLQALSPVAATPVSLGPATPAVPALSDSSASEAPGTSEAGVTAALLGQVEEALMERCVSEISSDNVGSTEIFSGVRLAESIAGGGIVSGNASLLQQVPGELLNVAAAEMNFERASRGNNLLALQHAAHALAVLGHKSDELDGVSARSVFRRPTTSDMFMPQDSETRFQRMKDGMARQEESPVHESNVLPLHHPRPQDAVAEDGGRISTLRSGLRTQKDFLNFAQRRFGNTMRLWCRLDREEQLSIGQRNFVRRCEEAGWGGSARGLWHYLCGDGTSTLTFQELDPEAAKLLASFREFMMDTFGSASRAFRRLDGTRSGRIDKREFVNLLKTLGCKGSLPQLFELLDRHGRGWVLEADFRYLDKWQPRPYFLAQPDNEGWELLRRALLDHYGSPLFRAWSQALDTSGHMRISWEDFRRACRQIRRQCQTLPKDALETAGKQAGIWCVLDRHCLGWVPFCDFDHQGFLLLADFKRWADASCGGSVPNFRRLHASGGRMTQHEMRSWAYGPNGYQGDIDRVFDSLDVKGNGYLAEGNFTWLDSWEIIWPDWEKSLLQ